MDIPWAVERGHRRSSEVAYTDTVRLVAQVNNPREQAGRAHTLRARAYSHSQGSGEEHHWKLRSTRFVSQTSFCYN